MKAHTRKNYRQRRGIYLLPSFFTVANLLCGYYAILSAMKGSAIDFDNAAKAIFLAIVLDGLDGRVARMTNASSPFGREFDSLADLVSFGIAPAFLALAWGWKSLDPLRAGTPELVQHVYQLGWVVSFAFLICGAWRLARFNILTTNPHPYDPHAHRYFVGLPIPAAAGLVAAVVHTFKVPVMTWYWGVAWLVVVASLAYLMVSRIRYYSFKDIDLRRPRRSVVVIVIGLLIWLVVVYSEYVLLAIAVTYALWGVTAKLTGSIKRRTLERIS